MGKKQDYLKRIFITEFGEGKHLKPSENEFMNSQFAPAIKTVYSKLNGQLFSPPTRFGSWDIDLKNFIVELDEERHFNRYRLLTLNSNYYRNKTYYDIDKYKTYCSKYENECLKAASWGKNWKNDSTEKQFGNSTEPKILDGNGASRWKQRAFYDFLKDVSSNLISIPIFRIAIYDTMDSIRIDQLINANKKEILLKYIEMKLKKHVGSQNLRNPHNQTIDVKHQTQ